MKTFLFVVQQSSGPSAVRQQHVSMEKPADDQSV
jgi:hypothetical protein